MKTYTIARAEESVPLGDAIEGTPWEAAEGLRLEEFTWHEPGEPKPETRGRMLYDEEALYLQFFVEDESITAQVTELNGPTFQDSSVELFADPVPGRDGTTKYFNFEPNCCGQFKIAWQEAGWEQREIGRDLINETLAADIRIETSVPGPTKEASPDDESWWLAAAIPFDVLSELTGESIAPESGTEWRGNVYRSGLPDAQKSTWNPIDEPEPIYHSPAYFGQLVFE